MRQLGLFLMMVGLLGSQSIQADLFERSENQFTEELRGTLSQLNEGVAPTPLPNEAIEEEESNWRFSRIQILTGAFAELDLKVIELKIQPYVEFRLNRRKPISR